MFLVVGLGNPGKEYASHRHNIGFMAADAIASAFSFGAWGKKFKGLIAEGTIPSPVGGGLGRGHSCSAENNLAPSKKAPLPTSPLRGEEKILLLKPQTYMNLSGESVGECASFYKIPTENIIVIHDELDLAPLKLRVKRGGGNGGHNGLKSIDAHCGKEYMRVRLGIGHPRDAARQAGRASLEHASCGVQQNIAEAKMDVSDYVLSNFSKTEAKQLEPWLADIARHFPMLLSDDMAGFMNKLAPLTTNN